MSTSPTVLKRGFALPGFKIHQIKNHPFVLPVVTFLAFFFISVAMFISTNGQTIGASDSNIVYLSIDGKQQVVPTSAATVKDLLDRLNITVSEQDIVTPALETPIYDDNLAVDVQKAKPVMIVDGGKKTITLSAQPTPREVAQKAGIAVSPEDKVESKTIESINPRQAIREGIASEQVVIDRAMATNLNLYGSAIALKTHADTVGELLAEKNIKPAEGDTVTPALDTPLTPDTQIFVVRTGHQVINVEEQIPAPVETISDSNLASGTTQVKEEGAPGKKVITYEVELRNDKEASRRPIQEVVVAEPVKRVVVKGTKVAVYTGGSGCDWLRGKLASMGLSSTDIPLAVSIASKESGCNPNAVNRTSGACNVFQEYRCGKWGGLSDVDAHLRGADNYAKSRYGSWQGAYNFWQANRWW